MLSMLVSTRSNIEKGTPHPGFEPEITIVARLLRYPHTTDFRLHVPKRICQTACKTPSDYTAKASAGAVLRSLQQ
jgi:hypothetical protein